MHVNALMCWILNSCCKPPRKITTQFYHVEPFSLNYSICFRLLMILMDTSMYDVLPTSVVGQLTLTDVANVTHLKSQQLAYSQSTRQSTHLPFAHCCRELTILKGSGLGSWESSPQQGPGAESARIYMVLTQWLIASRPWKVVRLFTLRAVPPQKVVRLWPGQLNRFRRQCLKWILLPYTLSVPQQALFSNHTPSSFSSHQ